MHSILPAAKSIDRINVDNLSQQECFRRFVVGSQPVLLTEMMRGELAPRNYTPAKFIERFGATLFRSSDKAFALPYATAAYSLNDYVERFSTAARLDLNPIVAPDPYIFHDVLGNDEVFFDANHASTFISLEELCPPPPFFSALSQHYPCVAARIAFGTANSHCGLHTHGAAVNMTVFGRKRWFLYPPNSVARLLKLIFGAQVASPQLLWLLHFHPLAVAESGDIRASFLRIAERLAVEGLYKLPMPISSLEPLMADEIRGIEIVQEAGEVMFIPDGWGHWILNEELTLSVVYQLEAGSTASELEEALSRGANDDRTTCNLRYHYLDRSK